MLRNSWLGSYLPRQLCPAFTPLNVLLPIRLNRAKSRKNYDGAGWKQFVILEWPRPCSNLSPAEQAQLNHRTIRR
jgi:hypothetical protein